MAAFPTAKFLPPALFAALLCMGATAPALPPAPPHVFLGDVRDEFGYLLPANGSKVVFSRNGTAIAQSAVMPPGSGFNYKVELAFDMRLTGSQDYISTAVGAGDLLLASVDVGGVAYLPMEISSPGQPVGAAAGTTRLDLTLGIDSDKDGLPDAWETNELYYGGATPGPNGWDLSAINGEGDYDRDGFSNRLEYIAGTYATDARSFHFLQISALGATEVEFRCHTIYGKTYSLESSTDLKTWTPVQIRLQQDSAFAPSSTGKSTGEGKAFCPRAPGGAKTFYRLVAR